MSDLKKYFSVQEMADRIEELEAENKLLTEQRDWHQSDNALRDMAIDKLDKDNERLRAENDAWQNQDLLEQSNRQADEIERLRAALRVTPEFVTHDALREFVKDVLKGADDE